MEIIKAIADKGKSAIKRSRTYPIFLPIKYNYSITKIDLQISWAKLIDISTLKDPTYIHISFIDVGFKRSNFHNRYLLYMKNNIIQYERLCINPIYYIVYVKIDKDEYEFSLWDIFNSFSLCYNFYIIVISIWSSSYSSRFISRTDRAYSSFQQY